MWTLSVTDTFLNELLNLPQSISKKVSKSIKVLEKDPISADGDAKKLKGYKNNVYRIRIGRYRVFYSFGQGWVKLLSVRKRDDRTYDTEIPEFDVPDSVPNDDVLQPSKQEQWKQDYQWKDSQTTSIQDSSQTTGLPFKLTTALLQKWQIPEQYWQDILKVDNSEALLELSLPDKLISRIIDNLYPRPIEEIEAQPEYLLKDAEDLDRFFAGDISAFLLKLDPEQEKLRDFGKNGPILVKGGPGTGKSTLAMYRVQKLLQLGYKPILFTTYTNSLVAYSEQLLEQLLEQPPKDLGVEVTTVDYLSYHFYVKAYGKPNLAKPHQCLNLLKTALSITKIPGKNQFDNRVRLANLEKLGLDYLLEEIQTVIETWGISSLEEYISQERRGRGVAIKANIREAIWAVYQKWLSLLKGNRLITWEQLRLKALDIATNLTEKPYQAVVIDEAQDLSPVALRFLLALVPDFSGVYFTADASQSLYQRGFSWKQVHGELKLAGRSLLLKRNYRNTQQITAACTNILANTEAGDAECLYQKPSPYKGDLPYLLLEDNNNKEIFAIKEFFLEAAQKYRIPLHGGAVLCPNSQIGKSYAKKLTNLGLKAEFVAGKEIDLKAPHIKVLTLHSAKGLEFPFVVVVGLEKGQLPNINSEQHSEETTNIVNEQRRLFYVGCSRAMRALMVCGSTNYPSEFISNLTEDFWQKVRS